LPPAAQREQLSYLGFLAELVMAECDDRDPRRAAAQVRDAGLARSKRLDEFFFDADPASNPCTIAQLAPLRLGRRSSAARGDVRPWRFSTYEDTMT
jgi:IstB-like ATP binding protein